jgi:hypothetical protein
MIRSLLSLSLLSTGVQFLVSSLPTPGKCYRASVFDPEDGFNQSSPTRVNERAIILPFSQVPLKSLLHCKMYSQIYPTYTNTSPQPEPASSSVAQPVS